uniref:uncharacterized protein LOC120338003 isoform X2 n=1 Tax=Styela clava TaxID=7725 RepID=UPI00193ABEE9|nr:uncharacterized protein LOC120338003 isoform X2 [Styela clava]
MDASSLSSHETTVGELQEFFVVQEYDSAGGCKRGFYQILDRYNRHHYSVTREIDSGKTPIVIHLIDNKNNEVLRMEPRLRPCHGFCCCFKDCSHSMEVSANGELLGVIRQGVNCFLPKLSVEKSGQTFFIIKEPGCPCCWGCKREVNIMSILYFAVLDML